MSEAIAIGVDAERCIGSGLCEQRAPASFAIGEEGAAVALAPPGDAVDVLEAARAECPSGAITIRRAGSSQEGP